MAKEARSSPGKPEDSADVAELQRLQRCLKIWETFASCAVRLIPVLHREMEAVTRMTEHAAMELSAHLQALASKDGSAAESDRAASLSRIVVAMQFQDITRQRLGHVGQALEEWRGYFQALLEETRAGHSSVRPLDQESMERDFVLMEARCSSIKAASEGAVKTETAGGGSAESGQVSESVTIF